MAAAKGFLTDFINKKLALFEASSQKGAQTEPRDEFAIVRYRLALVCLTKNRQPEIKDILKISPPRMSECQAIEDFLKNLSGVADEFSAEFGNAAVALSRIALWHDTTCLNTFPEQFTSQLDAAIKEIFPDAASWGNIIWSALAANSEKFLEANYSDIMALSVYSRAVSILVSCDNILIREFFDPLRAGVVRAIVVNAIQPMACSLDGEKPLDYAHRQMLLDNLSLLQSCLLAA
jgi:hypothetical protein